MHPPPRQPAGWDSIAKFLKWLHSIAVSNHHGSPPQKPLHYTSRYFDLKTSFEEFHDPTRSNQSQAEEGLADLQDWLTFSPIPALTTSASAHLRATWGTPPLLRKLAPCPPPYHTPFQSLGRSIHSSPESTFLASNLWNTYIFQEPILTEILESE